MQKPSISKKAFWDVPFDKIDYEKNSLQVMEKVFNYGDWNDQIAVMKFYGLPRIKKEIVNAGYLRSSVISFLCAILQLKKPTLNVTQKCSPTRYPGVIKRDFSIQ